MARPPLTADEADAIARRTAEHLRPAMAEMIEEAESKMLARIGLDPAKLGDVQKDFAFLRSQREIREAVVKHGILAVLTLIIGGLVTAVGFWFKSGMPK